MEIWKDIEGYEGYKVSSLGRVKSFRVVERVLSPWNMKGYSMVSLRKNNKTIHQLVHRLVAKAFILNPENKPFVNHKDFGTSNNSIKNLEWATPAENVRYQRPRTYSSKYKGVSWFKRAKKWMGSIHYKNKHIHLGYFTDEKAAALAYNAKAKELFGSFALLNEV